MPRKKFAFGCGAALLVLPVMVGLILLGWQFLRPQPSSVTETWFTGVRYVRDVRTNPRELVIHVVTIDLQAEGIRLLVTPGDPEADLPLSAQTTSRFLVSNDLQLAVNGSPFEPWSSFSTLNYYPHTGDRVAPIGLAASEGQAYSASHPDAPTLYFAQNNKARFNRPFANIYNALSGTEMLVENGKITSGADSALQPRTAIGLNRSERLLILVVVDGRQPGYSEGVTLAELAEILIFYEAYDAMNLDGGGSSTLVREGTLGGADLVNNPIDRSLPGWERVVGNHLGIFAKDNE